MSGPALEIEWGHLPQGVSLRSDGNTLGREGLPPSVGIRCANVEDANQTTRGKGTAIKPIVVRIGMGKNVFQLHWVELETDPTRLTSYEPSNSR